MQRPPIQSFSTTEALDLLRQGSGSAYFVPAGYIPILVPDNEEDPDIIQRLLEAHVPTQVPVDNLWQTRLPTKVMRTKRKRPERPGPAKKPPRPPNAFILYRKDKQVSIAIPHIVPYSDNVVEERPGKRGRYNQQRSFQSDRRYVETRNARSQGPLSISCAAKSRAASKGLSWIQICPKTTGGAEASRGPS